MCGIIGKVSQRGAQPVQRELLNRMCAALEHRGPDSRGLFVDGPRRPGHPAAARDRPGHRRSADLQRGSVGRRRPQRRDLQLSGAARRSCARAATRSRPQGDTEVIVHLYEEYGVDCVRHLHGMFAFALWDDAAPAAAARPRPRRQEAALLRAARRRPSASPPSCARCSQDDEIPREIDPEAVDASSPTATSRRRCRSSARSASCRRRTRCVLRDGPGDDRALLARSTTAHKLDVSDPRELHEPIRDAIRTATRRRLIADVPARRVPVGRDRLLRGRRGDGRGEQRPGQDVLDRLRERAPSTSCQHARRVAELFGTDHHEFVVRPDAIDDRPARSCATTASRSPTPRRSRASTSPS